jgi:hypothetical protein
MAKCYTFSERPDHILECETDRDGRCTKNCKEVKIENLPTRVAVEFKRFINSIDKYGIN